MSQIHKTLTSSFQLYLLFISHISFSFERTCTLVCKPALVGVPLVVCVAMGFSPPPPDQSQLLLHGFERCMYSEPCNPCGLLLSSLSWRSFPLIWLGTKVKWQCIALHCFSMTSVSCDRGGGGVVVGRGVVVIHLMLRLVFYYTNVHCY